MRKCDICNKFFKNSKSLASHKNKVHGNKALDIVYKTV
ncbi:MAG: hypothetical protein KGI11_08095 [Thaumarchaeota archaeon]|nr:hypothetical protein [Nitrososphaerota archaeon]